MKFRLRKPDGQKSHQKLNSSLLKLGKKSVKST